MTVQLLDKRNGFKSAIRFRNAHELDAYLDAARRTVKGARVVYQHHETRPCIIIEAIKAEAA